MHLALLLASAIGGASPAATPGASQIYRVELAGNQTYWATDRPKANGPLLTFHHYPDGALLSVRAADVNRIVATSADPNPSQHPKPGKAVEIGAPGSGGSASTAAPSTNARHEQGAGFPKSGEGPVDSAPLSFDTTWYDWGPYAAEMVRRIKIHWDIPSFARLGWKGKLTVRFFIMADGRVEGATFLSHSGVPPFDDAAMQAITASNPFRPLPRDLLDHVPGKDREGITVTFFYNIRPGEFGDLRGN